MSGIGSSDTSVALNGGRMQHSRLPSASRMRTTVVCSECKRQKQKCNRELPCSNCVRRGVSHLCNFPDWITRQKRSPERVSVGSSKSNKRLRNTNETEKQDLETTLNSPTRSTARETLSTAHRDRQSIGHLWNMRGGPSYHGESYFGPQAAARMIQVSVPDLPLGVNGIHARQYTASRSLVDATSPFCNESGPYNQIWELVGYLPRRKAIVDQLVDSYLRHLNPIYDSVHEETFKSHYDQFWNRRAGYDDLENIDLRWLALLFMVLAFGELLVCPEPCSRERQRDCEEASVHFYWAARKCLVIAPTFSGESPDLVRAGILVTRYLIHQGRIPESWLTGSFAVRMAQAQGMHIDGENWNLPRVVLETRRRLWATLYNIDRTICLALGRPYTIHEKHCTDAIVPNIWVDTMTPEEASRAIPRSTTDPTPSIYYQYHLSLSKILGDIHDECFGVNSLNSSYGSYNRILLFDQQIQAWKDTLPDYFCLTDPDVSLDETRPYLYWQRLCLHSAYHFARITLHRKYVLLPSVTDRFQYSREACIASACADLSFKLKMIQPSMADRLKFHLTASKLFSSALVLGIIAVREPLSPMTEAIISDLKAFCEKQEADQWTNDFDLVEIKIVKLCIANVQKSREESRAMANRENGQTNIVTRDQQDPMHPGDKISGDRSTTLMARVGGPNDPVNDFVSQITLGMGIDSDGEFGRDLLDVWFGPERFLAELGEVSTSVLSVDNTERG